VSDANAPTVSVVVPTLEAARFLADALDSIEAQGHAPLEVVVVDGGSTDRTLEIAARYERVRTISQSGSGLPDAWNCGIAAAAGELIAFLDADDRWAPDKLERQVRLLDAEPAAACVITRMRFVLAPGLPLPPGFRAALLDSDHVAQMPSALLARRAVFDRIGVFDTRWPIASDIDWFARVKDARLRVEVVEAVLVEKRVHDANLSTLGGARLNRELVEVLRASVERQRAAP
jgi:glycosyltransferase involved in cell wall biosynthesis